MRSIAYINWKGGVGKTTLATNTAYFFSEECGLRVLFIDLDKQGNASSWFQASSARGTISNLFRKGTDAPQVASIEPMEAQDVVQKTRYKGIDIISSDATLLDINLALLTMQKGRQDNILIQALQGVAPNYDVCIIDNPPDSNLTVLNGIELADDIIAVTLPNQFSASGIEQLETELSNYNEALGLSAKIRGVVFNQFTASDSTYEIVENLRKKYRILPYIRAGRTTSGKLNECINTKRSIFELSPRCHFARDLRAVISHVVQAG